MKYNYVKQFFFLRYDGINLNYPVYSPAGVYTGCRDTVYIRYISLVVSLILRASMVQARVGADYDCN